MVFSTREELELLIRSRYPVLYLVTWEEPRAERLLRELGTALSKKVYVWSITRGFEGGVGTVVEENAQNSPMAALSQVASSPERAIFVLKDFHAFLDRPEVVRALRDLVAALKQSFKTLVILSPVLTIPRELEKDVTVLDLPLPDHAEIASILEGIIASVKNDPRVTVAATADLKEKIVKAALGLTASEAENVFAKAVVHQRRLDENDLPLVLAEKKQILRKMGMLEYYDLTESIGEVGGLEELKRWLAQRTGAFSQKARDYGLPEPKGLLLLGVQGCGKSLTAQAIAATWQLPLLRLDMGRIFSGLIGSSEENLRRAIRVAESAAPAVLWVDEIDKGLSGIASSGSVDGGVTARVFGAFLTWLQEKTAPVFVVATANRIEALPPELLRKGRFDEIFFVDLPDAAERAQIFDIHLRRRGREPAGFDLAALGELADGFSGAEIEQAVV
ncbi:MAG TPA: AAA family ATPase, partial [bacterium]|nr:AAA family ATPase [bacterium]